MLNRSTFFIREHVGVLKLSDTYDIIDPDTQQPIGIAKEKVPGHILALRFLVNKQMLPTTVAVYEGHNPEDESRKLFSIERGFSLFRSTVNVVDQSGNLVGWFKSRVFTLGGRFDVFSSSGEQVASVKGDWKGWNFKFIDNQENEIGIVSRKWSGIGKEFFTSADNYVITLHGEVNPAKSLLLLAAGLAIDTIYKEQ